jgi:hypothetical protein
MLTAEQVEAAINAGHLRYGEDTSYEEYGEDAAAEFWSELKYKSDRYTVIVDGVDYKAEHVDSYGGMDKGSDIWVVFRLGDQLFKKSGFYASHYGTDWDGPLVEVKPVEKTVTVFEKA